MHDMELHQSRPFDFCTLDKLAVKKKENLLIVFFLDLYRYISIYIYIYIYLHIYIYIYIYIIQDTFTIKYTSIYNS